MTKKKKKTIKIECSSCEESFTLTFNSKKSPECCPFCAEDVRYYNEFDEDEEDSIFLDPISDEDEEQY